jgi:site-specific DNA-methyltransferase (adenine-specific)
MGERTVADAGLYQQRGNSFVGGTIQITVPATDEAKTWDGWGTALKPAAEHWILARKPLIGTVAANVQRYGTGAINIDGCRIGTDSTITTHRAEMGYHGGNLASEYTTGGIGRWPANVTLSPESAAALDAQSGERPVSGSARNGRPALGSDYGRNNTVFPPGIGARQGRLHNDSGGASRFYKVIADDEPLFRYVAKPSTKERNAGLESNTHPTVKPIALMRYLCRLITPPNGIILDPFTGSGTTGCAAALEGFDFIGIERESNYVEIARKRLSAAAQQPALSGVA